MDWIRKKSMSDSYTSVHAEEPTPLAVGDDDMTDINTVVSHLAYNERPG